jgi:hypothetical protein
MRSIATSGDWRPERSSAANGVAPTALPSTKTSRTPDLPATSMALSRKDGTVNR